MVVVLPKKPQLLMQRMGLSGTRQPVSLDDSINPSPVTHHARLVKRYPINVSRIMSRSTIEGENHDARVGNYI